VAAAGCAAPRSDAAYGIAEKLRAYVLNPDHPAGGHKLRRFQERLGIGADDAERLETAMRGALPAALITGVREVVAGGVSCGVVLELVGPSGPVRVRTAWHIASPDAPHAS
jgi:hypothetical protein